MSSSPLVVRPLILMALTSILVLPGAAFQAPTGNAIIDLIAQDEIDKAEALLNQQPPSAETSALRGEIEYRRGHLEMAELLYKASRAANPRNARAHFGLGKMALAKLRVKEAIRLFEDAIRLDPREPKYRLYASEAWGLDKNTGEQRKHLEAYVSLNPGDTDRLTEAKAGLELLEAFRGLDLGKVEAPAKPAPIQFTKQFNLLFTEVMVNGKGPFSFVIDTGASQTVFSESLGEQLGLKPVTTTIIHGVGGLGKVDSKIYKADELQIGDVRIKNLPVGTFDDPLVSTVADGIIGTGMFSDFILTVNYPEGRLELSREGPSPDSATEQIPAWYFSNLLLIPLQVNGEHRGNFLLDTGAVVTVLSQNMAAALGVNENTPDAKLALPLSGVGGMQGTILQVPDVTLKTQRSTQSFERLVAIDLKSISRMIETELSGVLGFDFLEEYKLTINYNKAEVWLSK